MDSHHVTGTATFIEGLSPIPLILGGNNTSNIIDAKQQRDRADPRFYALETATRVPQFVLSFCASPVKLLSWRQGDDGVKVHGGGYIGLIAFPSDRVAKTSRPEVNNLYPA